MTCCAVCGEKLPFFIAMFQYFLDLVQAVVFPLKAVENVLLLRQAWDESVKCLVGMAPARSAITRERATRAQIAERAWELMYSSLWVSEMALWDLLQQRLGGTHGTCMASSCTFILRRESRRSAPLAWVPLSYKNLPLKVGCPHFNFLELNESCVVSSFKCSSWLPWLLDTSEGIMKMENW